MQTTTQDQIFTHFAQYISLSSSLKDELSKRISIVSFNKGDLVHSADKICKASYFIQKGLLRTYYLKEEKEISEYFCAEGEWVNSPRSFMQQTLDIYSIDAIEPTLAFKLQLHDLGFLFDHFPEMERYARLSMGGVLGHLVERITSLRFTSAKEKYQHFCAVYAGTYPRIPLGMVAAYLGISQETLSRIRAEK
ncbi:Crp/Fnr family transcriptional regulator [Haliscomenobacter hydrossis]|uniref:Transcriptional regulator, Crp/Fnr family n=1 Tax=Haliscomenobacter hydrossis (strain ATCC 27775 / DSM 1100 / LMG 10767 / O) TaxID=760192 RepID=F4L3G3_HALH1|nr:Crp/Fnr family transcriptional regulator [Haliscomenobacter hydrossis]AEE52940.1 putative transcriptional regulator, Crp/Fnr family [Haliscomenobacter hydrossis DSM 1100]